MAEPSIVVRCPHCGHPYPMTELQREVYRGRTMGCVNCGRPIHVDRAIAAQFPVPNPGTGDGEAATDAGEAPAAGDASEAAPGESGANSAGEAPAGAPASAAAVGPGR